MSKGLLVTLWVLLVSACAPLAEFTSIGSYQVNEQELDYPLSPQDAEEGKTNVVFIASSQGTEIFDLLAPYEILARSGNYRLIVAAPEKMAIPLWKGIGIVPHATFDELDQTPGFSADVIVVPNIIDEDNERIRKWLMTNAEHANYVLAVCEGMRVIGNAELFKGAKVTTFSATIDELQNTYDGYQWVRDRRYVKSGRLITTAGVSAAVEGALALVAELEEEAEAERLRQAIGYEFMLEDTHYTPQAHDYKDVWRILKKITLGNNMDLGFLLRPGVSEMKLAAVMDTYTRTFPASLASVTDNNQPIISRHGLKLVPSAELNEFNPDQLHILGGIGDPLPEAIEQQNFKVYSYEKYDSYAMPELLSSLGRQYDKEFVEVLAKLLDYPIERL